VAATAQAARQGAEKATQLATTASSLARTADAKVEAIDQASYGEDSPAAPNTTRAGRSQNRRVVIRVLT
jgi:outer membrane protein OmpA-like peptidoglycan-associated protein